MSRRDTGCNIRRYWWHSIVATLLVAVAPPALALRLESAGLLGSALLSSLFAIGASAIAATIGATLWSRHRGSSDILFSELLVWGYVRRLLLEKRVMESAKLLAGASRLPGWHASRPTFQVQTLQRLANDLEARDPYTHGHSRRVARLSTMIAKQMGLPSKRVQLVRTAAAVHDVGKLYVSQKVINKKGRLSEAEFAKVKLHSSKGAELVAHTGNKELVSIVRHHHERYDGSGYPDGLAGVNIPLGARIIAVADTFDAITSTRSYRPASTHKQALSVLKKEAGRQLDPDAVHAFLAYYTGRRSLLRWVVLLTGPHRLIGQAMGWFQGAAASTVSNAATVGTAALVSGSVLVGGASLAPALAHHFRPAEESASGIVRSGRGHRSGLPAGLAKRAQLPPGLARKVQLPPGLARRAGEGKDHARKAKNEKVNKPARAKKGKNAKKVKKVKKTKADKATKQTAKEAKPKGSDKSMSPKDHGSTAGSGSKETKVKDDSGPEKAADNRTQDGKRPKDKDKTKT